MSTGSRPMTWNGAGALVESKRELRDEVFGTEGDEYNLTGSSVANLSIARLLCNRSHEGKRGGRLTSEVTASVAVHYARGDLISVPRSPDHFLIIPTANLESIQEFTFHQLGIYTVQSPNPIINTYTETSGSTMCRLQAND